MIVMGIQVEGYSFEPRRTYDVTRGQSALMTFISNSMAEQAIQIICSVNDPFIINQQSPVGNSPLLLATAKGWNHVDDRHSLDMPVIRELISGFFYMFAGQRQSSILETLLKVEDLNINIQDENTGMTALHFACLRGDDPKFIQMLLNKGADWQIKDKQDRTPEDLLNLSYEATQNIIFHSTCLSFNDDRQKFNGSLSWNREACCSTATLPSREERSINIQQIKQIVTKNSHQLGLHESIFV